MKKSITMFAVAAMMLFVGVSAKAANHPVGFAVKGPVLKTAPASIGGAAGLPITSISIGTSGATPEYNGAGEGYVDLPWLQDAVPAGGSMTTTIQMQDTTFSGAPAVFYSVLQNGKVLSQSEVVFPFDLVPNEEALAYFPDTAPSTAGSYEIVASIYSGSTLLGQQVYYFYAY